MTFKFGSVSEARLAGVHPDLVRVVRRALAIRSTDFMVLEGIRTPERQLELYAQGRTRPGNKVTWTKVSNHFKKADGFGHAVDLAPYPIDWNDLKRFDQLALAMFRAAALERVRIRWGCDWDQDGKAREKGENDSPHFELDPA